ncbi:MAG: hypothetical protein KBI28_05155 [Syntrophaceae bacterium]|nr:hypothetical protein [Syntrophaceae bacterium]MBP8608770.1 hypothetical protein [Syntrophaceae bacterium]NMD05312.1 hypothetical protein [Deltaproteobacteria bacterium]
MHRIDFPAEMYREGQMSVNQAAGRYDKNGKA